MITADMAREISGNDRVDEALENFEARIRDAAGRGERQALLCYCDCVDGSKHTAMEELRRSGFEIVRFSENLGGVRQSPGWYARW